MDRRLKKTNEFEFTHHCKSFDRFSVVGKSNHYFKNDKLIGICFCDNSNPKNSEYYVSREK